MMGFIMGCFLFKVFRYSFSGLGLGLGLGKIDITMTAINKKL